MNAPPLTQRHDGALMSAMRRVHPLATILTWLITAVALTGCGSSAKPRAQTAPAPEPVALRSGPPPLPGAPALPALTLALLSDEQAAPLVARRGAHSGLLVASVGGRWLSAPFGADGPDAAGGVLTPIAQSPDAAAASALFRVGGGYLLAWARASTGSHELRVMRLDEGGKPVGEASTAASSPLPVRWIEPLGRGDSWVLLWEVGHDEERHLWAGGVDGGKLRGVGEIARDVVGWHASATPTGAAVAFVTGGANGDGRVSVCTVAASGTASEPLALGSDATAFADVQVAGTRDGVLVGWTDSRGDDPHVYLAKLPLTGGEPSVFPPLAEVGPQALVALVSDEAGGSALLAWEPTIGAAEQRRIELQRLGADGRAAPERAVLAFHSGEGVPQLAADGSGFAAITLAPMRELSAQRGADSGRVAPHFVRFDRTLKPRGGEPLRIAELGSDGVPSSVRSLRCAAGQCSVVAAGGGNPRTLALTQLPLRQSPWQAPAQALAAAGPPKPTALDTVAELKQPAADAASARLADGRTLVAWLSHSAESGANRTPGPAPGSATLAYRFVDADGKLGDVQTLTKRAISIGGVAIAALPESQTRSRGKPVAVIAWAGKRGGDSQVFAAKIGRSGKVVSERSVTRIKRRQKRDLPNEVFDIDVVADGKGNFLCAWSDTRDGDPEIYVARINANLQKTLIDKRITRSKGPSTEVQLLPRANDRTALVWSDARDGERHADIYFRWLDTSSLNPRGGELRLQRTPGHSRTPRLAPASGGMMAYWIEEAGNEGGGAVKLLALDDAGEPAAALRSLRGESRSRITSATMQCRGTHCRGVLAAAAEASLQLRGFEAPLDKGAPPRSRALVTLPGRGVNDALLRSSEGTLDALLFVHEQHGSADRLRRLQLVW
jgi:hypothetical protein